MSAFQTFCAGLALVLCVAHARADNNDSCYFLLSYGQSRVQGIKTKKFEDKIFDSQYVTGGYTIDGKSNAVTIGGGCEINKYFAWEVDYREGFRIKIDSRGTVVAHGYELFDFHVQRFAEVRGVGLSAIGKYSIRPTLEVFGRLGVLVGKEKIGITSDAFPRGLALTREKSGVLPMVGAGITYKRKPRSRFAIRAEHMWLSDGNKFRVTNVGFTYEID